MADIHTGLLSLLVGVVMIIHIVCSYLFFLMYLEKIEDQLCDIEMFALNRRYYGESFLGRKMREIFVVLVIIEPRIFKKQEIIPREKLLKLSPGLRLGVKLHFYLMYLIGIAMAVLYFTRLRPD